jgi:hypothetical protein
VNRLLFGVLGVATAIAVTACSSGSGSSTSTTAPLRIDLVPAGVAAVEAARGGPQQYTEINGFDQGVNLFVATGDGNELAYVYRNGILEPPGPAQPATGTAFGLQGVAVDAGPRLLADVKTRLPEVTPVAVTLVQRPIDGLVWDVGVIGAKGGRIDVLYTPAGVFLGPVADQ